MRKRTTPTQMERVVQHLEDFKTITSREAFNDYGISRLSAIIWRLRKRGYVITTHRTYSLNRYGDKVNFATYELMSA